ncbi:MAG: ABC transporter permease [Treponema sp.]|nr:ABC transporter permease [Treponema sp.]
MRYVLSSLLRCLLLIAAVSVLTFCLAEASPIDPVDAYFDAHFTASEEQRALLAAKWGLNDPAPVRLLKWGRSLAGGDFGYSWTFQRPVLTIILNGVKNSLLLLAGAWILSGLLGFVCGVAAAMFRERMPDRIIRLFCYLFASTPAFWLGIIALLVFSVMLGWFPIGLSAPIGLTAAEASWPERLRHMALPALTLSVAGASSIALHTREKMIAALDSDYVLFARARGENKRGIFFKHGFRNILLPALTLQFGSINEIFGGSVLVENVFTYAGLGSITVAAGVKGDIPLLMGITIISSVIVFLGNLAANLLYPLVDPRIREDYDT